MNDAITKVQAGSVAKQEFDGDSLAVSGESMSTAMSARETAKIQSRYMMAMRFPRSWETVRHKMLAACKRPGFSDTAWYSLPYGERVEGFSIKFAEEAARNMGNIHVQTMITFENETERHVSIEATDLENNIQIDTTAVVKKTTLKKFLKKGQTSISVMTNSYGEPVYVVEATDAEMIKKQNSEISKAYRNSVLRFLPGDIKAECQDLIIGIRGGKNVDDKVGFRRKIIDSFADLGVSLDDLEWYLEHPIDSSSPSELSTLRDLYSDIKEGKTTWTQVANSLRTERGEKEEPKKEALDEVADKFKKKGGK